MHALFFLTTSTTQSMRPLLRANVTTEQVSQMAEFTYQWPSQLSICSSIVKARRFGEILWDDCQDHIDQCDR